ncbi:MAG TPA: hypothetical protein VFQ54_04765, partial [Thermomicrobiales bacterium]|nr:hypothetical protein [Thermomicrobiales bacterium]
FGEDRDRIESLKQRYREGNVGDVEVKGYLAGVLAAVLDPIRERREKYSATGYVDELIERGTKRVRTETQDTVLAMRRAMGFTGVWNRIHRRAERSQRATEPTHATAERS